MNHFEIFISLSRRIFLLCVSIFAKHNNSWNETTRNESFAYLLALTHFSLTTSTALNFCLTWKRQTIDRQQTLHDE